LGTVVPRALVLDDEPLISLLLRDWLTGLDRDTVGPVHSVRSATALVESGSLDAAMLDRRRCASAAFAFAPATMLAD